MRIMKTLHKILLATTLLFTVQMLEAQKDRTEDISMNSGRVEWQPRQIDSGKVPFGQTVNFEFVVKNISTESLILLEVQGACHCIVTEFSKKPVAPGRSTVINVAYDAAQEGDFYRIVTVLTNFDTHQSVPLAITGSVGEKMMVSSNTDN